VDALGLGSPVSRRPVVTRPISYTTRRAETAATGYRRTGVHRVGAARNRTVSRLSVGQTQTSLQNGVPQDNRPRADGHSRPPGSFSDWDATTHSGRRSKSSRKASRACRESRGRRQQSDTARRPAGKKTGVGEMRCGTATHVEVGMGTAREIAERVRAHYLEMPGMRLTVQQVQLLCGVERTICELVLGSLVEAQFLRVRPDGTYVRSTDGGVARSRLASASPTPNRQADYSRTQLADDAWRLRKCLL
jgi:hypothetical protein